MPAVPRPMRNRSELIFLYTAVAICAFGVVLHAACLHGHFVWDDYILISGEAIGGGRSFWSCFTEPFMWHYYRPLVSAWVYLERYLWGWNPVGYHFVGLVLHAVSIALVIELTRLVARDHATALLAGALFAVQPVRVPSVAWLGGRTDALAVLFTLLFALLLVRAGAHDSRKARLLRAAACAAFALAIFSKEQAVPLALLAPLGFRWFGAERPVAWRSALLLSAPFLAAACLFLLIGARLGLPGPIQPRFGWEEQMRLAGASLWHYAQLLFLPSHSGLLTFSLAGYAQHGSVPAAAGYAVLAAALAGAAVLARSFRPAAWFLLWAVLTMLPVANFLPLQFLLAAPYRASLPAVAGAILTAMAAVALLRLARRSGIAAQRAVLFAIAAYIVLNAAVLLRTVPVWGSEGKLFGAIAAADPQGVLGHYMVARVFLYDGRGDEATQHLKKVLDLLYGPRRWHIQGAPFQMVMRDRLVRARLLQNQGYIGDPRYFAAQLFGLLGLARLYANDRAGAEDALRESYALWDTEQTSCYARGLMALHDRDLVQAEKWLKLATTGRDSRHDAYRLLANIYRVQGRHAEALAAERAYRKHLGWYDSVNRPR